MAMVGKLFFQPKNNDAEHLAMIDRARGPIPDTMNVKMFQYRNLGNNLQTWQQPRTEWSGKKLSIKSSSLNILNSSTCCNNSCKSSPTNDSRVPKHCNTPSSQSSTD